MRVIWVGLRSFLSYYLLEAMKPCISIIMEMRSWLIAVESFGKALG